MRGDRFGIAAIIGGNVGLHGGPDGLLVRRALGLFLGGLCVNSEYRNRHDGQRPRASAARQ